MTPEVSMTEQRRCDLLEGSPVGRAVLAEFAKFNPDEWEPHSLGSGRRAGKLVFRRKVGDRWQYRDTLPPDYVVEEGRVYHADQAPFRTITPPAARPDDIFHHTSFDPLNVVHGTPEELFTPRKVRLALAALAEHHARKEGVPVTGRRPFASTLSLLRRDADARHGGTKGYIPYSLQGRHWHYIRDAFDRHMVLNRQSLSGALRWSNSNVVSGSSSPEPRAESDIIRSIFLVHPDPITIPLSPDIRAMAARAYDKNDRDALGPLSDALYDAGATPHVLAVLRHPHSAVRGNWVLDAILGKR